MAKCPECNAGLDHLISWSLEWHAYKFVLRAEWYDYEPLNGWLPTDSDDTYQCPKCGAELFHTAESAFDFLKRS